MADMDHASAFIQLAEQIKTELRSLETVLGQLPKTELIHERYLDLNQRINYIQMLFDRAGTLQQRLSLDASDPLLYDTVSAKEQIKNSYARFNNMRMAFFRQYGPKEAEQEVGLERIFPAMASASVEDDEELSDEIFEEEVQDGPTEEELVAEAEMLAAEAEAEEKAEKASKKKAAEKKRKDAEAKANADAKQEEKRIADEERFFRAKEDFRKSEENYLKEQRALEQQFRDNQKQSEERRNELDSRVSGEQQPAKPTQEQERYFHPDTTHYTEIQVDTSISYDTSHTAPVKPIEATDQSINTSQPQQKEDRFFAPLDYHNTEPEPHSFVSNSREGVDGARFIPEQIPSGKPQDPSFTQSQDPLSHQTSTIPVSESKQGERYFVSREDYQEQMRHASYVEQTSAYKNEQTSFSNDLDHIAADNGSQRQYSAADVLNQSQRDLERKLQEQIRQENLRQQRHTIFERYRQGQADTTPHYWADKGHFDFSAIESDSGSRQASRTQRTTYQFTPEGTAEMVRSVPVSSNHDNEGIYGSAADRSFRPLPGSSPQAHRFSQAQSSEFEGPPKSGPFNVLSDAKRTQYIQGEYKAPRSESVHHISAIQHASGQFGQQPSSQSGPNQRIAYHFGSKNQPAAENAFLVTNNAAIYSALSKSGKNHPISPAYEESMKFNLRMARLNYEEKRGTPEAKSAAHEYMRQRQAYMDFRKDVRSGSLRVERPKITASGSPKSNSVQRPQYKDSHNAQYSFTPDGIKGKGISQGTLSGSDFSHKRPDILAKPSFSPQKPLHVTPAYEAAITDRMKRARASMNTALQRTNSRGKAEPISRQKRDEVKLAMGAYIGFQNAKRTGSVVVSSDAKYHVPDFNMWQQQQRKQARNARRTGTTAQSKAENLNRPQKKVVEEPTAHILGRKNKLKTAAIANHYMKVMSNKFEAYAPTALMMAGRKFYSMMQSGDDNALRTAETMRYYGMTAYGIADAVVHARVVDSKALLKAANAKELRNFGALAKMNGKEISREIAQNIQTNKLNKADIRLLISKGKDLTSAERLELLSKMRDHAKNSRNVSLAISYQKMHREFATQVQMDRLIEQSAGRKPISIRTVDRTLRDMRKTAEADMVKRFGKLNNTTNRSLIFEIESLKKEARSLKDKIRFLQSKGSALTAAERKALLELINRHKTVSKMITERVSLQRARSALEAKLGYGQKVRVRLAKNRAGWMGGLYALRGFILRPLQEGSEAGAQGLVKFVNVSTNHYVHLVVKKTAKAAYRTGKAVYGTGNWIYHATRMDKAVHAAKTAVKSTKTAQKTMNAAHGVKNAMTSSTRQVRLAIRNKASTTARTATSAAKDAVTRLTPVPVRTAVSKTGSALQSAYHGYANTRKGFYGAVQKFKDRVRVSWVGRTYNATNRFFTNVGAGIRRVIGLAKGVLWKALLFILAFLLIVAIISAIFTNIGGVASSVIMSPEDTEEGQQVNLEPYYNYLMEEWTEYQQELKDKALEKGAYKVILEDIPEEPGNIKNILSMMAVYLNQDVDLSKNKTKNYLAQLLRDGNPFDYVITYCKCEDENCKTKRVEGQHEQDCSEDCKRQHWKYVDYCPGDHEVYTYSIFTLYFDEIFWADTTGNSGKAISRQGLIADDFKITYYCACSVCCGENGGLTYSETVPKANRTIAVDPNVIPLGSRVMINGQVYVAEDIGGAIDGNRIDIFVNSHQEALNKGVDNDVAVYWADYAGEGIMNTGEWDGWNKINRDWAKVIYNMPWSELYTGIPSITDAGSNSTDISGVDFVDGDRAGNQAIVNLAKAQLGNQGGRPYWSWYGFAERVEWCATFVSWCANEAGVLGNTIPKFASCHYEGIPWFKSHGQWASGGEITPVAGDIIFFDWKGDGRADHVGIVIGTDGSKVYTVEGNSSDAVRIKSYALDSSVIYGYGLPNY